MRIKLWNLSKEWNGMCDIYDYSYDEGFYTQILFVCPDGEDYFVTCWNGTDIFSFIDSGQTKIFMRTESKHNQT